VPDARALRELERAFEAFADTGAVRYRDPAGVAIYQVAPTWATAIACTRCLYVAIMPTLPAKPIVHWECSRCGAIWTLLPPLEVRAALRPPVDLGVVQ
jgi:hypothetical protein